MIASEPHYKIYGWQILIKINKDVERNISEMELKDIPQNK